MLAVFLSLLLAAPKQPEQLSPILVRQAEAASISKQDLALMAKSQAMLAGLDPDLVSSVIECESHYDVNAEKITPYEDSVGIAQINLKAWTDITRDEALDPFFSIDFLIKQWELGNAHYWTCYGIAKGTTESGKLARGTMDAD